MNTSDPGRSVLVCMDSFKGSVSAPDACRAVERGLLGNDPSLRITLLPMADGGEGTAEAVIQALNGEWIPRTVTGPLPHMQVDAGFAWFPESHTALVELASASGLPLLLPEQRNPLLTSTFGTGELLQAAMEYGAERLLLAVGGSATNDAGMGCARALGWRFLDAAGRDVPEGGGGLADLAEIIAPDKLSLCPIEVLCDVTNPFTGPLGASVVYGPQKGATPEMVRQLDANLQRAAKLFVEQFEVDIEALPGSGAAGGIAGGAVALFGAELVSGVDTLMDILGVDEQMRSADWLITGEGSFDEQSLHGKVISGLCRRALQHGVKVAVMAGQVSVAPAVYRPEGIRIALAAKPPEMKVEEAMANGAALIEQAAGELNLEN